MKVLVCIIFIMAMMAPLALAWEHEMWVDDEGVTHIVGKPSYAGEAEVMRLREVKRIKELELLAKKECENRQLRWLIETRNSHEVELKEIEEQTSANFLEAVRLEAEMNRDSRGELIYVNNSR